MSEYVIFLNSRDELPLLKECYSDCHMVRVPLSRIEKCAEAITPAFRSRLWIDAEVDGFAKAKLEHFGGGSKGSDKGWLQTMEKVRDSEQVAKAIEEAKEGERGSRRRLQLRDFVLDVLDRCRSAMAAFISIPQLPWPEASDVNQINRELANAAREWRDSNRDYEGKMILPVVFDGGKTRLDQKARWWRNGTAIEQCVKNSQPDMVWVAYAELKDNTGMRNLRGRLPTLVNLHQEIKGVIGRAKLIAGPYWGMNLIMWARGIADMPAMHLGNPYVYYIPGGWRPKGKARVAIPPLRRYVILDTALKQWCAKAADDLDDNLASKSDARGQFRRVSQLPLDKEGATDTTARFYKSWFDSIASLPEEGRALAMFQQLSESYVIGKNLPPLPKRTGENSDPGSVAQQLMLTCL